MNPVYLSFDVGVRNLAVCKLEIIKDLYTDTRYTIHHWEVMDVLEGVPETSKKMGIPETAQHMIDTLLQHEDLLLQNPTPCGVLIEQQPGGKFVNVGMKALSHVLQAFMYLKAPNIPIHFVSARKKLQTADSHDKGVSQKKRYSSNKQFAKETALNILQTQVTNSEEASLIFNSRSKKDDLADSLLQAVAFTSEPPTKKPRKSKK